MSLTPSMQRSGPSTSIAASRTMVTTAASSHHTTKVFIFASEWFFKPEGVRYLTNRFEKELVNKDLTGDVEWNRENSTFHISCPYPMSEEVWGIFFKVAQHLIAQESGGGWEDSDEESHSQVDVEDSDEEVKPAKSNKIQPLSAWKKQNGVPDTIDESEVEDSYQPMLGIDFPEKIRYYKSKTTWEYEAANHYLDDAVSDEILVKLAGLVGCEFVKDLNQGKIYIGATSAEECRRAICKLDNIKNNFGLRFTYVKHLFYTEELENYQISFKHAIEVKKKFFKTTFLDNLSLSTARFDYRNLPFAVAVRCAIFCAVKSRYTPFKMTKYYAAVNLDNKDSGSREWKDFKYSSYIPRGNEQENAMARFERYRQQSHSQQPEQTGQTEQANAQAQSLEDIDVTLTATQDTLQLEGIQRWMLGQDLETSASKSDNGTSNNQQRKPNWDTYVPYTEERVGKKKTKIYVQSSGQTAKDTTLPHTAPLQPSQVLPMPILEDIIPKVSERNRINDDPEKLDGSDCPPAIVDVSCNFLDENISMLDIPVLQPIRNVSAPSSPLMVDLLSDYLFDSPPRVFAGYPVPQRETMQSVDGVVTNTFRSTMNQKAPKPNRRPKGTKSHFSAKLELPSPPRVRQPVPSIHVPVIDPIPEFIGNIDMSFGELLQGLRSFQGELNIQAEFGRILLKGVPRKYITRGESEASIEPGSALGLLENSNGVLPMPVFTKVLTTLPPDISYLVEMKDRHGNIIWEQQQSGWDVFYEILCVDCRTTRHRPFTIEIDGEKLDTVAVKIRREFGAINVHGVKRQWDFRIAATGVEDSENADPAYTELAKAVKSSLYIPEGLRNPLVFFEVPGHLSRLVIFGVRVRRITRYRSLDAKSLLAVSEVRELQIEFVGGEGCTIWKAVGCLDPSMMLAQEGHQYKWLYLWHEVSISCPKANEMFEQNKSIELGDEAPWTPETLSNIDAVQSMYLPACEMLKQMDGVGFYNDNAIDTQPVQSSAAAAETEPPQPYYFW